MSSLTDLVNACSNKWKRVEMEKGTSAHHWNIKYNRKHTLLDQGAIPQCI